MAAPDDRLLSTEEVAEKLQVDEQTVRRWIKSGKLKAFKPGREWRISPTALEALLEAYSSPKAAAPPSPEPERGPEEERRFRVQDWEDTLESLATLYEQAEEELRKADPGVFPNKVIDVAVLASHHLRLLYREEGEVKEAPGVVAAEKRIQHAKASVERMIDQFLNPMSESHVEQTARFKRAAARGATASYTSKGERKGSDDSAQSAS